MVQRAMQRLDAKGRGILLLHDIHPATAMALPRLLKELKDRGYWVVHVVPAGKLPESVSELPAAPAVARRARPRVLPTSAANDGAVISPPRQVKNRVVTKIH